VVTLHELELGEQMGEQYVVALVTSVENDDARRIREIKNLFAYDEGEDRYRSNKFRISAGSYPIRCAIK
jgi:hypothetical protein